VTDLETILAMLERADIAFAQQTVDERRPGGYAVVAREIGDQVLLIGRGKFGLISELIFRNGILVSIEAEPERLPSHHRYV
jgi:hypothetical protein